MITIPMEVSTNEVEIPMTVQTTEVEIPMSVDAAIRNVVLAGVTSWNGETGDVVYTPPVSSVNGQTGDVEISVPTKTSELQNDSGYITDPGVTSFNGSTGAVTYAAPVSSVNGATGAVTIAVPEKTSDLTNDSGYVTAGDLPENLSDLTDDLGVGTHIENNGIHVTQEQKNSWTAKQDAIQDLADIRSGAALGATALQTETDPVYSASAASGITAADISAWNGKADPTDIPATYAGSASAAGPANKAVAIPFGECDSTSTATAFTATVSGITALYDGVCAYIKNGVISSASGWTLNVNGLGALPVYQSQAAASRTTTIFNVAYTGLFIYNSGRVDGGCWDYFYGYNSDTNTLAYQVRRYQSDLVMHSALTRYKICFTRSDGTILPATAVSNNTGTSKALTTDSFDPWGAIYYYSTTTGVSAGASPGASYMWLEYSGADLRYSFNTGTTLTAKTPVYVQCAPQADGSVKLSGDNCITQTLPATADGYVYIRLGVPYDTYRVSLDLFHPAYYFSEGALRLWTNAATGGSGLPAGGTVGQLLIKQSATDGDAAWVSPATAVEQDNTLPITSAAVYTEVGNINALLATI